MPTSLTEVEKLILVGAIEEKEDGDAEQGADAAVAWNKWEGARPLSSDRHETGE